MQIIGAKYFVRNRADINTFKNQLYSILRDELYHVYRLRDYFFITFSIFIISDRYSMKE